MARYRCEPAEALLAFSTLLSRFNIPVALSVFAIAAIAQETTVFPRLETGVHTGSVMRLSLSANGRTGATVSEDFTARLWDMETGRLKQTLRPPLSADPAENRLFVSALSPQADRLFVAGTSGRLEVFDIGTGQLVMQKQMDGNVATLARSQDGARLVIGNNDGQLLVVRTTDLVDLFVNNDCKGQVHGADFDRADRLAVTCFDGFVRLYDAAGRLLARQQAGNGNQPFGLRFSPDGERLAFGYLDTPNVTVLSGLDLSHRYTVTSGSGKSTLWRVAWSLDGTTLAAGGHLRSNGKSQIVLWREQERENPIFLEAGIGTVVQIEFLDDGRILSLTQEGELSVFEGSKRVTSYRWCEEGARDGDRVLRSSANGTSVQLHQTGEATGSSPGVIRFDLQVRRLELEGAPDDALRPARTYGLPVTDWRTRKPKFQDAPLNMAYSDFENSKALDIASDRSSFALGTIFGLYHFDADGRRRWFKAVPSAWAVHLSDDGRFVIAALGDGTVRWYDVKTGNEKVALYVDARTKRWVLFTPEGFYEASPDGDSLLGYQLKQGADKADAFVDSAQLAAYFFRPDLITKRLEGDEASIDAALKSIGDVQTVLISGLPPTLKLLSAGEQNSDGDYELKFQVTPPTPRGAVGDIMLYINGAEVTARAISPPGGGVVTQRLSLAPGTNVVSVRIARADGKVTSSEVRATVHVTKSETRPMLHILAVGVSQYDDATFQRGVKFASKDAELVVEQLRKGGAGVYREVNAVLLKTRAETSLERIEKELKGLVERARAEDVVVIFLAGHGKAPDGQYHFIPADFVYDNENAFKSGRTLSNASLEAVLRSLGAGKRLLILDTCDSGTMSESRDGATEQKDAISRLIRSTGRYILAAASPQGKALEDGVNGHGVYTSALVEGLEGAADPGRTGVIEVDALASYVAKRVPELTEKSGYLQRPIRSARGENFPIVLSTRQ